jgi:hypothetical protein
VILPQDVARLAGVITVGVMMKLVRMGLGWFDRRVAAPVMRERINSASDGFFEREEKSWGKSEIDSILHGRYGEV